MLTNNDQSAEAKRERIRQAQAALRATGKSPRALGAENELKVVDWIYRWGWSGAGPINALLGRTSGGYAQRLVKKGLLRATRTASGTPREFYTLTESGLELATRHTSRLHEYRELDPARVNQQQIRHYLLAQNYVASMLNRGSADDFRTEREQENRDQRGDKRPDAILLRENTRIGVEIELSAKFGRQLDEFVLRLHRALLGDAKTPPSLSLVVVASDSPALLAQYFQTACSLPAEDAAILRQAVFTAEGEPFR